MIAIRLRRSTFRCAGVSPSGLCSWLAINGNIGPYTLTEQRVALGVTWVLELAGPNDATHVLEELEELLYQRREGPGSSLGVGTALKDVWLQQQRLEVRNAR